MVGNYSFLIKRTRYFCYQNQTNISSYFSFSLRSHTKTQKKRRSINNIVREMKTGENGHHLGQCFTAARQPPATTPAARKAINRRLRCVVSDQIPVYRAPVGCKRHSGGDTGVNGCYDELPASPGDAFHLRQAPTLVLNVTMMVVVANGGIGRQSHDSGNCDGGAVGVVMVIFGIGFVSHSVRGFDSSSGFRGTVRLG
ncbi:hypothetical protein HanIR_Chr17g0883011 [Helianthus annuus]|nr:hypothetical protein HanIR_Chr17g0883011 [Helianthus annuus]